LYHFLSGGPPGIGKTQLSIQLAVSVQTSRAFGGPEGAAVYIGLRKKTLKLSNMASDTEGSFTPERAYAIARDFAESLQAARRDEEASNQSAPTTAMAVDPPERWLERIHVFRAHDHVELATIVDLLDRTFLDTHRDVCLLKERLGPICMAFGCFLRYDWLSLTVSPLHIATAFLGT